MPLPNEIHYKFERSLVVYHRVSLYYKLKIIGMVFSLATTLMIESTIHSKEDLHLQTTSHKATWPGGHRAWSVGVTCVLQNKGCTPLPS